MPRTLRIEDQGLYDVLFEVVKQPTIYESILQLQKLNLREGKKSPVENYLYIYYHSLYLMREHTHEIIPRHPLITIAIDNLKSTHELSNFNQIKEIQGPSHSNQDSFILPKWSYRLWEHLFLNYSDKLQYFKEENDKLVFTPEALGYFYSCENPGAVISFWTEALKSKSGITQDAINNNKPGLKDLFNQYFLLTPYVDNKLLGPQKELTGLAIQLWNVLCKGPSLYKDLRLLLIQKLCYLGDMQHSVLVEAAKSNPSIKVDKLRLNWGYEGLLQQLSSAMKVVNCYLEFAQTDYGPKLSITMNILNQQTKTEIINGLFEMMRIHSETALYPLNETEKSDLRKKHMELLSDQQLYQLAHEYAQTNWPVLKQIKTFAQTRASFDTQLFGSLERDKHESNKASWPESFKKLEKLIEQIEEYQKAPQGKISGTFNTISSAVTRIPGITTIGSTAKETLDLGWSTTRVQLATFNSAEGFNLNSINSGYLFPFVDAYRKENFGEVYLKLDVLPLVLSDRLQKIIPPAPAVQQEVKKLESSSI